MLFRSLASRARASRRLAYARRYCCCAAHQEHGNHQEHDDETHDTRHVDTSNLYSDLGWEVLDFLTCKCEVASMRLAIGHLSVVEQGVFLSGAVPAKSDPALEHALAVFVMRACHRLSFR